MSCWCYEDAQILLELKNVFDASIQVHDSQVFIYVIQNDGKLIMRIMMNPNNDFTSFIPS